MLLRKRKEEAKKMLPIQKSGGQTNRKDNNDNE